MVTTTSTSRPMLSMEYACLDDIDEIRPISEDEAACIDEVRQLLERSGLQDRFGLSLLHKHFDLAEDEVLVEYCDKHSRTLTTMPVKLSQVDPERVVQTQWKFDGTAGRLCVRNADNVHDHQLSPVGRICWRNVNGVHEDRLSPYLGRLCVRDKDNVHDHQ